MQSVGLTFLELLLSLAIFTTVAGMAIPMLAGMRDRAHGAAAAQYVIGQAMWARSRAATTGAAVGLRFAMADGEYRWTEIVDGDGDGIRGDDLTRGIDRPIGPSRGLADRYPAVRFELGPGVPPVGSRAPAGAGADAIRLGRSDTMTFGPLGTASSGTLYLRSRKGYQFAVRSLGTTGRLRLLRYDEARARWEER